MTCYSSKYIGDKLHSYCSYEEYLLMKLLHKVERKYKTDKKHDKKYYIWGRGYYTRNGFNKKYNPFHEAYTCYNELYEDSYFYDELLTYKDLPCVYFDFNYHRDDIRTHEKWTVKPEDVIEELKNAAMITHDPIIIENLTHRSNAKFFRVVIPLYYYNTREEFYYENPQRIKLTRFNNRKYNQLYNYIQIEYSDLFSRIYMLPNYESYEMEFYLRYKGEWSYQHRRELTLSILQNLYDYCKEHNLTEELKYSHILVIQDI